MNAKKIIVNICRVFVGALFIVSGFIKANDPLGFSYKLDEYFRVFHIEKLFPDPLAVYISMAICVFEIFVGAALLIGVFRNFTAWMLLIMIIFFSFLTFYSAYFNVVKDCGCFGDALHLKPWQSFGKDMVLLVLIIPIFILRKYINPVFGPRTSRTAALLVMLASVLFTMFAYYYLPPIDFRPYAVGKDIQKQMELPPNAVKDSVVMTYIYKSKQDTNKKISINADSITHHMDSVALANLDKNYTYVTRKDDKIREGDKPAIHDFAISVQGKDSDVTKAFLSEKGYRLMIVQYNVEKSSLRNQPELNRLIKKVMADGKLRVWAITSSSMALSDAYRKANNVPYTFYTADETMLKTITRSNPGLVMMHDNVVVHKWPATALPDATLIYSYMK
jgi:uncharacterized membrane protein YphA (DoxX/SURF4 family)